MGRGLVDGKTGHVDRPFFLLRGGVLVANRRSAVASAAAAAATTVARAAATTNAAFSATVAAADASAAAPLAPPPISESAGAVERASPTFASSAFASPTFASSAFASSAFASSAFASSTFVSPKALLFALRSSLVFALRSSSLFASPSRALTTAAVRSRWSATSLASAANRPSNSVSAASANPTRLAVPTDEPPTLFLRDSIAVDADSATLTRTSRASRGFPTAMRHAARSMFTPISSASVCDRSCASAVVSDASASAHRPLCISACPRSRYSVDNRLCTLTVFLHPAVRIIHPVRPSASALREYAMRWPVTTI